MSGENGLSKSPLSESDWSEDTGLGSDEPMDDNGEGEVGT